MSSRTNTMRETAAAKWAAAKPVAIGLAAIYEDEPVSKSAA